MPPCLPLLSLKKPALSTSGIRDSGVLEPSDKTFYFADSWAGSGVIFVKYNKTNEDWHAATVYVIPRNYKVPKNAMQFPARNVFQTWFTRVRPLNGYDVSKYKTAVKNFGSDFHEELGYNTADSFVSAFEKQPATALDDQPASQDGAEGGDQ